MAKHNDVCSDHSIVLSMADLSFWCYDCSAYIINPSLEKIHRQVYYDKFGKYPPSAADATDQNEEDQLIQQMKALGINASAVAAPPKPAAFDKDVERKNSVKFVADAIKQGKAKNIVVLTGAGLSTAAGIPDFRSRT